MRVVTPLFRSLLCTSLGPTSPPIFCNTPLKYYSDSLPILRLFCRIFSSLFGSPVLTSIILRSKNFSTSFARSDVLLYSSWAFYWRKDTLKCSSYSLFSNFEISFRRLLSNWRYGIIRARFTGWVKAGSFFINLILFCNKLFEGPSGVLGFWGFGASTGYF